MTATTPQGVLPLIGRILIGLVFLLSGVSKLGSADATQAYIASAGLPLPLLGYLVAVVVEIGGGLLLLLGYRVRPAAIVLAAFTLAAGVCFHHAFGDRNQFIHFMKNLAITGGLLHIVAFGAGGFSLDSRRGAQAAHTFA